ncbi:MAG TPA: BBE domain-containing protein, partial [Ktedonobacterales bacterium]|nr:BBE domain-containing protein [Ktedonobacterales bacterium]
IDNLLAVELVTAAGEPLRARADEHPDLFWAVRGAGANFGVVTAFTYQLHPVQLVLGGLLLHPMARAREMLRFYREFTRDCPDELTVYAALLTAPDGHPAAALALCYTGDFAEGERVIAPLRRFGPPVADFVHLMDLYELNSMIDAANPRGRSYYEKASAVPALTDEAIEALIAAGESRTSPFSTVLIQHMHGAATRVDSAATAFGARDEAYYVGAIAEWEMGDATPHAEWCRSLGQALAPHARKGIYVNFLGDEGEERIRASYGDNYDRLVVLKNRYDPTNVFHRNQNIKPSL